jgi:DNA-binding MarR family transcriptional regulator
MSEEINNRVSAAFFRVLKNMRDVMSFESKTSSLTMIQLNALIFVKKNREVQMKDLAKRFSVTMPTATSLVDKLIASGYLSRKTYPKDRRVVKIQINRTGQKLLDEAIRQRSSKIDGLLSSLSREDKGELLRILEKITQS